MPGAGARSSPGGRAARSPPGAPLLVPRNPATRQRVKCCCWALSEDAVPAPALPQLSPPPGPDQCKPGQASAVNYKLDPELEGHCDCSPIRREAAPKIFSK